jgi:hypothetical protein
MAAPGSVPTPRCTCGVVNFWLRLFRDARGDRTMEHANIAALFVGLVFAANVVSPGRIQYAAWPTVAGGTDQAGKAFPPSAALHELSAFGGLGVPGFALAAVAAVEILRSINCPQYWAMSSRSLHGRRG